MRGAGLAGVLALLAASAVLAGDLQAGNLRTGVVFTDPAPLATPAELLRRFASPLDVAKLDALLARTHKALPDQTLDLADERFAVYQPAHARPSGYGLLVFVPPWNDARLPRGWADVMDREGLIFVSAARSGNDQSILDRRASLALDAAESALARFPIDRARIYVAGFSGGSRVALRLALGYPDVFRGAVLIAGADPIGASPVPPPPADLFARFQTQTRLVYLTGEDDAINLAADGASLASMHAFCVADARSIQVPHMGHEVADGADLARALAGLDAPPATPTPAMTACRAKLATEVATKLDEVQALIARHDMASARVRLEALDRRDGGLAAPRSLDLWRRIEATPPS